MNVLTSAVLKIESGHMPEKCDRGAARLLPRNVGDYVTQTVLVSCEIRPLDEGRLRDMEGHAANDIGAKKNS